MLKPMCEMVATGEGRPVACTLHPLIEESDDAEQDSDAGLDLGVLADGPVDQEFHRLCFGDNDLSVPLGSPIALRPCMDPVCSAGPTSLDTSEAGLTISMCDTKKQV
jgi:hypothetical protein